MKNLRTILAASVVLLATASAIAQPSSGGPAPGTPPTAVPLDGGATLLLAGGVSYALKKLRGKPRLPPK